MLKNSKIKDCVHKNVTDKIIVIKLYAILYVTKFKYVNLNQQEDTKKTVYNNVYKITIVLLSFVMTSVKIADYLVLKI